MLVLGELEDEPDRYAVVGAAEEGEEDVVALVGDGEGGQVAVGANGEGACRARQLWAAGGLGDAAEAVVNKDARVAGAGCLLECLGNEVEVGARPKALTGVDGNGEGHVFGHTAILAPRDQGKV